MSELKIETVPLGSLRPWARNPRRHGPDLDNLVRSMESFGFTNPILVQRGTNRVIAGHGRLLVAKKKGLADVPVIFLDLNDRQADLYTIADNKLAERSEWDEMALKDVISELDVSGMDMTLSGFDSDEIGRILGRDSMENGRAESVPDLPTNAVTHPGDVWEMGAHRLMCGDSGNHDHLAQLIDGIPSIDLVVTSPPYNCDIEYASHDDDMKPEAYRAFIQGVASAWTEKLGGGRFMAWNVGVTPKSLHFEHAAALAHAGLSFYRQIVWAKSGVAFPIWQYTDGRARKYHPNYTHEVIYLFSKGVPEIGGPCQVDDDYSRDVWHVHQAQATVDIPAQGGYRRPTKPGVHGGSKSAAHPAAYPVGIPAGAIKHLTAKGETVGEPFCGSGTTIIACEILERTCLAMEKDARYCDLAVERWQNFSGGKAKRMEAQS